MPTRPKSRGSRTAAVALAIVIAAALGGVARAQTDATAEPAPKTRPPEGERIINLPSAEVPVAGTLSLLFTHRFSQPLEDSDIHSLYSFDSGAEIGIGLGWTPFKNLEIELYRSSNLDDYEVDLKFHAVTAGPVSVGARAGADFRTERGIGTPLNPQKKNGFFGQVILGFSIGSRVTITAVPTYVSQESGQPFVQPKFFYKNVFNVPAAISIGVTRTVNVHGELIPRNGRGDSPGVGWIASIEKTVPRHRFAFTVGNVRATTVDQYVAPDFVGLSPHRYFIGFNLVRQWKL